LEPGRTPVLLAGPYLTGEGSHASNAPEPVYIADWYVVPGYPEFDHQFFDFVAEVRDVAGYERSPSHVSTEEAVRRGIEETQREFDSMVPAVLFTHESDHIMYLEPEEWDRILKGVLDGLKQYEPIPVTWEFEAQYLRVLRTSKLLSLDTMRVLMRKCWNLMVAPIWLRNSMFSHLIMGNCRGMNGKSLPSRG
jgi:hypothetical protein